MHPGSMAIYTWMLSFGGAGEQCAGGGEVFKAK